jgi:molybdopterin synthase sulfur carrier subunit
MTGMTRAPEPDRVTVRYWAAAKAAAGVAEEEIAAETLGEALAAAEARHGAELARVLARCSFLVDGVRTSREAALPAGSTVEALPPFAGG